MLRAVLHPFALATACALLTACAHTAPAESTDLLVVGRIDTTGSTSLDEWGLNVMFTGDLKITRVLKGRPPPSPLPVRYIAHSAYASDREREFHLRRAENGSWLICREGSGRGYICR